MFVLLAASSMAGCQQDSKTHVTITVIHAWGGTEPDHVAMRNIYQGFEKENPDIRVQFIAMPTRDEILRKIEDMVTVGHAPDVVAFGGMGKNNIYDFMAENGMLLDLMPYIRDDAVFAADISDANLQYWQTAEGELLSISDVLSLSGGYWYNKKIFASAGVTCVPTTWDEFYSMSDKIQAWAEREKNGVVPFEPSAEGYLYFMDHLLMDGRQEDAFAEQNTKQPVSDHDAGELIEQLKKIDSYTKTESAQYSYRDETNLFNEGKLAIYVNGVWGAPMITDEITAEYALLPTASGTSMSCESACLGYVLGKSMEREKQEASIRFLKYMMSEDVQLRIFEETGQIPANPKIALEKYRDKQARVYQASEKVLHAQKKIEVTDNFWTAVKKAEITDGLSKLLSGELTDQQFQSIIQ